MDDEEEQQQEEEDHRSDSGLNGSTHVTFSLNNFAAADEDASAGQTPASFQQGHKLCICGDGDCSNSVDDDESSVTSRASASTFESASCVDGSTSTTLRQRRISSATFNPVSQTTSAPSSRRNSLVSRRGSTGSTDQRNSLLYSLLSRESSGDDDISIESRKGSTRNLPWPERRRKKRMKQAKISAVARAASATTLPASSLGGQVTSQEPTGVELWRIFYTTVERAADRGTISTSEVLKRATYLTYLFLTIVVALVYAVMYYFVLGQTVAGHLAIVYVAVVLWSIEATVRYELYGYAHVLIKILVINPFNIQFALGGMINSGWVGTWGLLSPVGAALILSPKSARNYLAAFIFMVTLSSIFEVFSPTVPDTDRLSLFETGLFWIHYVFFGTAVTASASVFAAQFETEQSHSEGLLLNILPAHIARRLKRGESPIVDHYGGVTTLFADLVGFEAASEAMDAERLVGTVLKDVFTAFDECLEWRKMEKIKTVGSRYMAVCGLNEQTEDVDSVVEDDSISPPTPASCAENAVLLGLELQHTLAKVNERHGTTLELRVGVHTGSIIAGVRLAKVRVRCLGR
eukprot:scaffold57525_cov63-Attheya_sp.AAC.5